MTAENVYVIGSSVRVSVTFTAVSGGAAYDPTAVGLMVRAPDGSESTYTYALAQVTKSGTGAYYKDIDVNQAGHWSYYWYGTGTGQAADNGSFRAEAKYP